MLFTHNPTLFSHNWHSSDPFCLLTSPNQHSSFPFSLRTNPIWHSFSPFVISSYPFPHRSKLNAHSSSTNRHSFSDNSHLFSPKLSFLTLFRHPSAHHPSSSLLYPFNSLTFCISNNPFQPLSTRSAYPPSSEPSERRLKWFK